MEPFSKGKINEARNIVRKIARINGTEFPNVIFDKISLQEKTEEEKNKWELQGTSMGQMLKSRRFLLKRYLLLRLPYVLFSSGFY